MKSRKTRIPEGMQGGLSGSVLNEAPKFPYRDLREWLVEAEKLNEVKHISGASWEDDIGMASELVLRDENAPCVVFDDVPGCAKGFRVLTNFFGGKRMNMTMGFSTDYSKLELTDAFQKHRVEGMPQIPFEEVQDGPVLENVLEGDDIDVTKFPTPHWHPSDGGRYIGTGSYDVTQDPDTGALNMGTYRVMVQNEKQVSIYISPGKHGRIHRDKYEAKGERMPIVVVIGGDPMDFLIGCSEVPQDVVEFDLVGGMRGEAKQVIRGKHTGLPFPANAEIVLEGFIEPGNKKLEGPFGEWTGYYASDIREEPVMDIKAIYHRDDPIILGCPPQRPPDELGRYRAVTRSALLRDNIVRAGVPDVSAVWAHEVGGARMLLGVAIKQRYGGHARQVGHIASQCHVGAYAGKYVVVVDDDIDVSNLEDLMWAMVTRSDPASSIDIVHETWSTPLDPRVSPENKAKGDFRNSQAIIDATRPFFWRDEFPMVNSMGPELQKEAMEKWGFLLD